MVPSVRKPTRCILDGDRGSITPTDSICRSRVARLYPRGHRAFAVNCPSAGESWCGRFFSLDDDQRPVVIAFATEEDQHVRITTLAILISSLMACAARSGGGGPGSGSNTPDAPAQENAVSIKSIRMTQPTNGTMITLQNVVVTGHVSSKK